ncbi:MarR family winged helix-turn-helix transcriptional regulator [Kocuria turfanensis]|uniref:Transcriptional regulator n=1 Tax=Kocuria turfanensis TaxID=388357 RepID=A0A512IGZ6_9MICC|nr:MarR family transcriptional regulator [Kocuria turfanensis]GEO96976.1 transcriptional regulator [Kocuria turfanensis]
MADRLHIGALMFIAYRSAENRIIDAVRRAGFEDLTVPQARILARIGPDGTRLSELAEQAQVTKQTATVLVDHLERAGYVARTPDPRDGRARLVRISGRGADLVPIARAEEARIEAEWTAHLGPEQMTRLRDALTELRTITDPYGAPTS